MKGNFTGRSIKGGGGLGKSTSPCSQSGMDPNLPRGRSSQLNFDINAQGTQIESISRHFKKLRDIRFGRTPTNHIYAAYKVSQDFNKPTLNSSRLSRSGNSSPTAQFIAQNAPLFGKVPASKAAKATGGPPRAFQQVYKSMSTTNAATKRTSTIC